MGCFLFRNGCYFLREHLLCYFFRGQIRGFRCGLDGEFILPVYVGMQFDLCPFFTRLFMPLDYLARMLVIRNLIRFTRSVLCAQPRLTSPVGAVGYDVGVS
jgi:hypothetical protein